MQISERLKLHSQTAKCKKWAILPTDIQEHGKDFLNEPKINRLLAAAKKRAPWSTKLSITVDDDYRHGLRASEVIAIRITDLNPEQSRL